MYVLATILGTGDTAVNKIVKLLLLLFFVSHGIYIPEGMAGGVADNKINT